MSDVEPQSSGQEPAVSKWWYGIIVPAGLALIGWISARIAFSTGLIGETGGSGALIFVIITLAIGFILTPLFVLSLFLDARKIKAADTNWNPNPYIWGMAGLATLLGLIVTQFSLLIPVALFYLYRRSQRLGLTSDLSSTGSNSRL